MATADQYFKSATIELLYSTFYDFDGVNYNPKSGLSITPIIQAHPLIPSYVNDEGDTVPEVPKTGDGSSYYINVRADSLLLIPPPEGVFNVSALEAIPVTGMWA